MRKVKVNFDDYDDNDLASRPDEETPEWTVGDFKNARPALDVIAEVFGPPAAESLRRGRGRPAKPPEERKVRLTLRVDADVVDAYQQSGKGWQSRINQLLREHMRDGVRK
jgi:uncharacterized protein (DUF4415 family)